MHCRSEFYMFIDVMFSNVQENPFIILNSTCLWSKVQLGVNNKQKFSSLPEHQLDENSILIFGTYERAKKQ